MTSKTPERAAKPAPSTPAQLPVLDYKGKLVADSREVSLMIDKRHDNLLRDIGGYIEVMERNNALKSEAVTDLNFEVSDFFIPRTYTDNTGRTLPCYLLTKKGCDMVANKQTGEKGILFTAAYVTAFENMRTLLQERASPIWQDTRSLGKEIRRMETDAIKELVGHAKAQGSRNADRYYTSLSKLADRTAGIENRDKAQVAQLTALFLVEQVIAAEIAQGIQAGTHYKTIYQGIKDKLSTFQSVTAIGGRKE